jgi:isopenicillin-N epimerase
MLLDPAVAYLNAAAAGPLSRRVFDRVSALRRCQAVEPVDFLRNQLPPLLGAARAALAAYLGGDPHQLVLTTNATAAINLVASSIALNAPGEVVMTDHEYPPMQWCWERAAARLGLTVRRFPLPAHPESPDAVVDAAVAALGPQTRLLFFSHVISSTGLVMPARALCAAAASRGVVSVVDGAQAPGFIDIDVRALGCDYYAGSGHKWLLAPTGTGCLHAAPEALARLQPLHVSWGGRPTDDVTAADTLDAAGRTARLRALEIEGTRDLCPWLALPDAIELQAALGLSQIRARQRTLAAAVRAQLTGWRGLAPVTPDDPALSGGMVAFALPAGVDPARLGAALWLKHRIDAEVIERPGCALLRVSTHFFNNEHEIDRLIAALGGLLERTSSCWQ